MRAIYALRVTGLALATCSSLQAQPIAYTFCYPVSPVELRRVADNVDHPKYRPCPDLPSGLIECPVSRTDPSGPTPEYFYNAQCFLEYHEEFDDYHLGDDWNGLVNGKRGSADKGAPVYAVADGEIIRVEDLGEGKRHEWGKIIVLAHKLPTGETIFSFYAHLESFLLAPGPMGYEVSKGQQIGTIGDANGEYEGLAHLHFEMLKSLNHFPGRGYVFDWADPLVDQNYLSPSEFIADRGQCVASFQSPGTLVAAACAPPTQPPSVDTLSASNITSASAELRVAVTPGGADTEAWFTWDDDSTPSIETPRFNVGSGIVSQTYSYTKGNLSCETTYFFRAHAENSAGSDQGSVLSFTTGSCSDGGGSGSTEELLFNGDFEDGEDHWVTDGDFYIDAAPNPRRGNHYAFLSNSDWTSGNNLDGTLSQVVVDIPAPATSVELSFYYSISTTETTSSTVFDRLRIRVTRFGGTTSTLDTLSNLDATGTSYSRLEYDLSNYAGSSINLQFVAETDGSLPTTFRLDDVSLVAEVPPGGPPSVSTNSADQISENSARLNLSVNPNGLATDVWFEWDDDTNLSFETSSVGVGSATSTQSVSISLFDLECDTTYYFAAVADNDAGSDTGSQRSFTTDPCPGGPPSADTDPAINVTQTSAVLTAEILPNGRSTEAWFEWGTSTSLGNDTPRAGVGSSQSWRSHQQALSNLDCDTTYYFESHAENSLGADDGSTLSFTTSDCGGGGGEPPPQGFFAWAHRQGCHGTEPAILLEWSPAANASHYTVERLDGAYSALIDPTIDGLAHLVAEGFEYGQSYIFRVLAESSSGTTASNSVTVYVVDQECVIAGQPNTPPGPFIPWLEPPTCNNGSPIVELHWTEAAGAESYTLVRHADSNGIKRTVSDLQGTGFVDSMNITPGAGHAYTLEAFNAGAFTGAQRHLDFYPRPDLCGDAGLPGEFVLTAGDPYCANGEPTIPIIWTASSGADDFYRVRALADGAFTGGSGFSTNSYPFTYEFRSGVRPGFIHQLYMVSFNLNDDTKTRYSNSVFLAVSKDVCGPPSLAPDASTRTAVGVNEAEAILRGSVRPNGSPTTTYFEWGTSASYGETTPPVAVGDAMIFVRPSAQLSDLSCGTEYHFRLVASNAHGAVVGSDASFLTADCLETGPPTIITGSATSIEAHSVTLSLTVNPHGLPTEFWYRFGRDTTVNTTTTRYSTGGSFEPLAHERWFSGLQCATTYFHRVDAENEMGLTVGETLSFVTGACPSANLPPSIKLNTPRQHSTPTEWFLGWSASDLDDDAEIHLYRSRDSSCSSPTLISPTFIESADHAYSWDTAGLPDGSYYILGIIDDGEEQVSSCTIEPIVVASAPALIFSDSFEDNTLSNWSSVSPATREGLLITPSAALFGTLGLEVELRSCSATAHLTIPEQTIFGTEVFEGCQSVSASNVDLETGSDVTILSGGLVSFGSGFSVQNGARLRVRVQGEGNLTYLENVSPAQSPTYVAEFYVDASGLSFSSGTELDLLVGYNQHGQQLFRITMEFDEQESRFKAAGHILPHWFSDTWWRTSSPGLDPGPQVMMLTWRTATSAEDGSVRFCVLSPNRLDGSCGYQYFSRRDAVAFIRWGIVDRRGSGSGVLKLDQFRSRRD